MSQAPQSIEVFYSYAHNDERLRDQLETHLSVLRQQGVITEWHDRKIIAGTDWKHTLDRHLDTATVILLLISSDFFASDYCYGTEMQHALARHAAGNAIVIPILLRPVDWQATPFAHLQCVPTNGKPVTMWSNRDAAFSTIAKAIRIAIEHFLAQPAPPTTSQHPPQPQSPSSLPTQQQPLSSEYHSCVLSYATENEDFAQKLHLDLQRHGVPCWFAPQDFKIGDKLRDAIYQAIDQQDKLLLILSEHAIKSMWVEEEVNAALDREHLEPGTFLLFPICLDELVMHTKKAWARAVRQRYIGNFTQWNDEMRYTNALQRLLRDLEK